MTRQGECNSGQMSKSASSPDAEEVEQLVRNLQHVLVPSSSPAKATAAAASAVVATEGVEETIASLPPITSPHQGKTLTLKGRPLSRSRLYPSYHSPPPLPPPIKAEETGGFTPVPSPLPRLTPGRPICRPPSAPSTSGPMYRRRLHCSTLRLHRALISTDMGITTAR